LRYGGKYLAFYKRRPDSYEENRYSPEYNSLAEI